MIASLGKLLQLFGMIVLPIGLYVGMFKDDVRTEVQLLAIGGGIFLTGWLLTRKAEK